ncbi:MAG: prenyltransferase/squalene oxidase repeat-containing protein [Patulibacter sp.]
MAVTALAPSVASAATDQQVTDARAKASTWLQQRQLPTGSLGASRGLDAAWALIGLAGNGTHAADLRSVGDPLPASAQDYYADLWSGLDDSAWSSTGTPQATDYARTTLIATAAGIDPTRIAPHQNLVAKLGRFWRDGYLQSRTALLNQTIFGLIALQRVEAVPPALIEQMARNVEAAQHVNGAYSFVTAETPPTVPGGPSPLDTPSNDLDFTGAALAALCGAGRTVADASVADAVAFLQTKRLPNGAFGSSIGNVDSNAWVLQGLGTCGIRRGTQAWADGGFESAVDWLIATQRSDGAWALYPEMSANQPADAYATQDALRALIARPGFAVDPPARATPGDPVWRPVPAVAAGTAISVALVVDSGIAGERELCEVPTVAGATLRELLEAARTSAAPADCVAEPRWASGALTVVNGRRTDTPTGGWRWSVDGGTTEVAADETRTVSAGDVISLRLVDPSSEVVPSDPDDPDPPVDPPVDPGPDPDPDPPVDPPYSPPPGPPFVPPPGPPFVPPPGDPAPPSTPRTQTVRLACRRASRNRTARCTISTSGRFRVTATLPGRKAVAKTARARTTVVVRSPRTIGAKQRIRLRIVVGERSRTITVRADGRTTTSRI